MDDEEFLSQLEEVLRSVGLDYLVDQERLAGEEGKAKYKDGNDKSRHVEFEPLNARERIAVLLDLLQVAIRGRHEVCLRIHELSQLGDSNANLGVMFLVPGEIEGGVFDDRWQETESRFDDREEGDEHTSSERLPSLVELREHNDDVELLAGLINTARQMYDLEPSRDLIYADFANKMDSRGRSIYE